MGAVAGCSQIWPWCLVEWVSGTGCTCCLGQNPKHSLLLGHRQTTRALLLTAAAAQHVPMGLISCAQEEDS